MSQVRELTFTIDTLSDVDLSGVNTTLRHLSTKKRPVEPRHIVDFSAISRPDDRTVILRVTLDEGIFVADTTSPRNGKNFITGHAPEVATVVMSNALDPNLNGTVKFDGSTVPSAQVTLDGQHVLKIDLATAFPSTYNAVGGHTIEVSGFADIEGNPQTQDEMIGYAVDPLASSIDTGEVMPYTANLKTGILRCSRLVMERGANIEEQLTRYLRQRGMDREHILHQSLVTTHKATLELYVLYLESVNPRLLKSFPNQGSTLSLSNPPTTYFFTFSAPLSLQCIQNNQAVLYDGTYVGDANVSLTPDEQTLVVDISGLAGANTAGLHSFELTDLCGVDGVNFTSVPTYIDVTVAEVPDADATAGGGGGGNADSFGAIDADGTTVSATGDDTLVLDPGNAITITGDDPNTSVTVAVDETQISHTNIADTGTLTHPQIDTKISQLETDVGTNTTDIGTNTTNIGTNTTAITNLDNDLTAHTGASNPHGTTIVDLDDTPAVAANTDEILRWDGTAWVFVTDLTNLETDVTNNTTAINNHITTTTGNPHQVTLEEARTQGDTFSGPVNLPAADPTLSTHAAHKGYVDSEISALPAPPTADSDLTNDQYVTGVNGVNGPGPVTIDPDDLSDASTTNKFVTAAEKAAISTAVQSVNGVSGTTPVIDPDDLDDASTAHKFVSQAEKDDIGTAVQPGDTVDFTSVTQGGTAVILEGDSRLTDARTPLSHTHPIADIPSIDQDDMASDSDQHVPTQQSVKAYVDDEIAAIPSAPVDDVNGQTGNVSIGIAELDDNLSPTTSGQIIEWNGTAWVIAGAKQPAGVQVSTDVTLDDTNHDYLTITGQEITLEPIDLAADVTGNLPYSSVSGTPTISTFGETLIDDADAATARTTLGVDAAGTDNSTPVTLDTTNHDYLSLTAQEVALGPIDLTTDVTGQLPYGDVSGTPTISAFGETLIDDATAADARSTLGVDAAGTDNSTPVTLAGTPNYITISATGQIITRNPIDLTTDVTNDLPVADGGTGASNAADARTNLGVDAAGTDNSTPVTLAGTPNYITISNQTITRNQIDLANDVTGLLPQTGVDGLPVDIAEKDDLITLSGVGANNTHLGTFPQGAIISDDVTIKAALVELDEAISGALPVLFEVHNDSGAAIVKGTPVYVSGTHTSGKPTVAEADANGTGTNPAIGLVYDDIANGAEGNVALSGLLTGLDTSSYSAGAALYVSETAGDLTTTRPTATNTKVQKVGLVTRSHATSGSVLIIGAGRSNDINNELVTLTGVALNESDLGTFTGATILDNRNVKQALQDLETETEQKIEFTDLSAGGDLSYDGSGGFSFTERTDPEVNSLADARIAAAAGVSIPNLSGGKIPSSQLPAIAISEYLGAVGSQAALTALSGQEGDWAIRTDENKTYIITTGTGSNFSDWVAVATPSAPATNLGNNPSTTTVEITSSTGANTTIPAATTSAAGVMTDQDKQDLSSALQPIVTSPQSTHVLQWDPTADGGNGAWVNVQLDYDDLTNKPTKATFEVDHLETLVGAGSGATDLGTFGGTATILTDGISVKEALEELEAEIKSINDIGAEQNVQADWSESDSASDAFINNKPTIPSTPGEVGAAPASHSHTISALPHSTSTTLGTSDTTLPTQNAVKVYVDDSVRTDGEIRGAISVTDAGGDGSLSYDNGTGVFTFTGPAASEVRAHINAGGDLAYNPGTGTISFTERTDAEVRGLVSVTDSGGDGSLSYDSGTGVITYTGPSEGEVRAHIDTAFVDGLNVDAATLDGSVKADFATASHNHSLVSLDDVATGVSPSNNNQVLVWSTGNGGEWILADLDDKADASAITNFIVGTDVPTHETDVTVAVSGENYIAAGGTNGHELTASAIDLSTTHVTGTLPVSHGGTGSTTAIGARNNLGLGTSNTPNFSGVTVGVGLVDVVLTDDVRLDAATTSQDGLLSTTDKGRLDDLHNNTANYITSAGAPVQSVNSQTGAVSLDADDIPEAATTPTNLYFTNARADARITAASISDLNDVNFTLGFGTIPKGDILYHDGTDWTNLEHPASGAIPKVAVATGTSTNEAINYVTLELNALDDVVLGTEADNHVLYYDNGTKEWKNRAYTDHLSDVFDTASATSNKVIQWNDTTPGWELIDTPSGSSVGTIGDLTNVNTSADSLTNTAGDIGKTITWTGTEFQAQKNETSTDAVEAQGFFFG